MTEEYKKYRKKRLVRRAIIISVQLGILGAFFGFWQLFASTGVIDAFMFSSPSRIVNAAGQINLWGHIWASVSMVLLGFFMSMVFGVVIALLLYQSSIVRRICDPYISVLNAIPKVALGPMLIIWFGANNDAILAMCILVCTFAVIIAMLDAFYQVDEGKLRLMKVMGANRFMVMYKLLLPATLPVMISVAKINLGIAWIGVIMGEFLVANRGLGYLINYGRMVFWFDLVYLSIIVLSIIAALMYYAVAFVEKLVKR